METTGVDKPSPCLREFATVASQMTDRLTHPYALQLPARLLCPCAAAIDRALDHLWRACHVPVATFIAIFLYTLSGAVNVVLLLLTRPQILLFGPRTALRCEHGRAPRRASTALINLDIPHQNMQLDIWTMTLAGVTPCTSRSTPPWVD